MENLSTQAIGCNRNEFDRITDNIQLTLSHKEGKECFERYLKKYECTKDIKCLEFYEKCRNFIEEEKNSAEVGREPSLEVLKAHVEEVKSTAENLDFISEIDYVLMERICEAINSESSSALLTVLEDTKDACRDHLKTIHKKFKKYAAEPCPLQK
ncbi:uncharacterized protein LOC144472803 [Augochlora pura]